MQRARLLAGLADADREVLVRLIRSLTATHAVLPVKARHRSRAGAVGPYQPAASGPLDRGRQAIVEPKAELI